MEKPKINKSQFFNALLYYEKCSNNITKEIWKFKENKISHEKLMQNIKQHQKKFKNYCQTIKNFKSQK